MARGLQNPARVQITRGGHLRRISTSTKILIGLAAVLIVVRIAAPYVIEQQIDAAINGLPGYTGNVDDVDLMLWRGGIALDGITIFKTAVSKKVPLIAAERAEASILWRSLLRGGVVARSLIVKPRIEMTATSDADAKRDAAKLHKDAKKAQREVEDPNSPIGELVQNVPIRIDRFEVRDGFVRFRKTDTKPLLDMHMDDINLVVSNLTNSEQLSDSMWAKVEMTGKAQDSGDFSLTMNVNPTAKPIDLDLHSKLLHLAAKATNSVTMEYGKFDFEKGTIDLITEVRVRKGYMRGYVKPLLRNIEVSSRADKTRDNDNVFRRAWEAIVGATEEVVENQDKVQSGTKIPIEGPLDNPGTDLFAVAAAVLRNAYVRALVPNYDSIAH